MPKRKTRGECIQDFVKKYRDRYIYDEVDYVNNKTKVCIICRKHGRFWIRPNNHLSGQGCPRCKEEKERELFSMTFKTFQNKASRIHTSKYEYVKESFKGYKSPMMLICPIHGEFWQSPRDHLCGCGCQKCGREKVGSAKRLDKKVFIERATKVHNGKFLYSNVNLNKSTDKVCIICPVHGEFWQEANSHLQGIGCPICRQSKLESEIRNTLEDNNIQFVQQFKSEFLGKLSLDFYLPKYKIGIECQGTQHFYENHFFEPLRIVKERDERKFLLCKENGITVLYYSKEEVKNYPHTLFNNAKALINEIKRI